MRSTRPCTECVNLLVHSQVHGQKDVHGKNQASSSLESLTAPPPPPCRIGWDWTSRRLFQTNFAASNIWNKRISLAELKRCARQARKEEALSVNVSKEPPINAWHEQLVYTPYVCYWNGQRDRYENVLNVVVLPRPVVSSGKLKVKKETRRTCKDLPHDRRKQSILSNYRYQGTRRKQETWLSTAYIMDLNALKTVLFIA